jgi:hypothetical protein
MSFTSTNFNTTKQNNNFVLRKTQSNIYKTNIPTTWNNLDSHLSDCINFRSNFNDVKPNFKKRNFHVNKNINKKNRKYHNIHQPGRTNCEQRYHK